MVEELAKTEKEARKARQKTRMLWLIIVADLLLFGYAIYEIVALLITMGKK